MKRFLIVGSGGRESSIIKTLAKENMYVFCYCKTISPLVRRLLKGVYFYHSFNIDDCVDYCKEFNIDIVIIGSEQFLVTNIVEELRENDIKCIAPCKELAKIETNKAYARGVIESIEKSYNMDDKINPDFIVVNKATSFIKITEFLNKHQDKVVVKPCGLHGGKGVKVYGDHLFSSSDILNYVSSVASKGEDVLIEEKLDGIEFSLISMTDGVDVISMPPVQDFKRLNNGNKGPNTGSMGCVYDGLNLNFLAEDERKYAAHINKLVLDNINHNMSNPYKGFLYGSFIKTPNNEIKVIEFNARLGDPEGIILLKQLDTDHSTFSSICFAIANSQLRQCKIAFKPNPAVCYYLVPAGYPNDPIKDFDINVECITYDDVENLFSASIGEGSVGNIIGKGSRSFAICCSNTSLHLAQNDCFNIINKLMCYNSNKFFSRTDIVKCYKNNTTTRRMVEPNPYLEAGVNIAEGNKVVRDIADLVKSTYNNSVLNEIGAFGGCYDMSAINNNFSNPVLVSSIDGVGTKSILSIEHLGKLGFYNLGQDLVNHSINDILVQGAQPIHFLDYIASSKISSTCVKAFLSGVSDACKEAKCAILGGETAEMPNIYTDGAHDFVGVITGVVEKSEIIDGRKTIRKDDIMMALPSSGPHTNGYSLIRKLKDEHPELFDNHLMNQLCVPHRSYLNEINILRENHIEIHGLSHITGGGFDDNVNRVLPNNLKANYYDFEFSQLFQTIQQIGSLSDKTMKEVFNCGYGMIIFTDQDSADGIKQILPESIKIGYVSE